MAQLFSADAQASPQDVNVPSSSNARVVSTNPLQVPFQTAKAKVVAVASITPDADETSFTLSLIRNRDSENLLIASMEVIFPASSGNLTFAVAGIDLIPDQRAVSYLLQGGSNSNTGNDVVLAGAYIEATLISG